MERPYDDIELKGATSSATGLKTAESFSSDSLEIMGNGENDKRDMARLGKKQEFKRNFSFWSALGSATMFSASDLIHVKEGASSTCCSITTKPFLHWPASHPLSRQAGRSKLFPTQFGDMNPFNQCISNLSYIGMT